MNTDEKMNALIKNNNDLQLLNNQLQNENIILEQVRKSYKEKTIIFDDMQEQINALKLRVDTLAQRSRVSKIGFSKIKTWDKSLITKIKL